MPRPSSRVSLVVMVILILTGCAREKTPILISDPVFLKLFLDETAIGMKTEEIPFANDEQKIVKSIQDRYRGRLPDLVFLSPLYSVLGPSLAGLYPETTFFAFGIKGGPGNLRDIPYNRIPALEAASDFIVSYCSETFPGSEKKIGVLFLTNTQMRREEYAAFTDSLSEKAGGLRVVFNEIPRIKDKNTAKNAVESMNREDPDILFLFLGGETLNAMNLVEEGTIIVTESIGRYDNPDREILLSLENDYAGAINSAEAGNSAQSGIIPSVPVVIRYNPEHEEEIRALLKDKFGGFRVIQMLTLFKKKV